MVIGIDNDWFISENFKKMLLYIIGIIVIRSNSLVGDCTSEYKRHPQWIFVQIYTIY